MKASPELRDVIAGWFAAVSTGDTAWTNRHISHNAGARLVGTDPNEMLTGEKVAEFLQEEASAMAGMVKVSLGNVEAYEEGSVGWGLAHPTLTLPNGKDVSPRWSAVFHQEDGQWKLVQLHASVGIANEELLGMEVAG
ncbi:MAG: nuclear transport factor 2 family protein [Anaerolineaceae bacterium]|nr:nuclear transport factor 2 family protein [Anaerolineaceae bacterium]